jgi:3-methyladenine DNA glycosylase AlkD
MTRSSRKITHSPGPLAEETLRRLRQAGDPRAAEGARRFFKPQQSVRFFGLNTAAVRRLVAETCRLVRGEWTLTEALDFCDRLIRDPHLEAKMVGVELLGRYHRSFERSLLRVVEGWLSAGHCANWATVDDLAPRIITPLVERFPGLLRELRRWTTSGNLWIRRAAVVTLVRPARRGDLLDESYDFAQAMFGDREDLMHKCTGWLLREAGRTDQARLERFLRAHGPAIPRTSVRYAIERFPETQRKRILRDTRGAGG